MSMDEDLYQLQNPDGSYTECTCGNQYFRMMQDKMPWCAVLACTVCETQWLGCAPETRANAIWN